MRGGQRPRSGKIGFLLGTSRMANAVIKVALVTALVAGAAPAADAAEITDEASAIAAAKRYTKARCSEKRPCEFRARREGSQWNVMVEFARRGERGEVANKYPGGHLLLYFNRQGQLVRRVEGE